MADWGGGDGGRVAVAVVVEGALHSGGLELETVERVRIGDWSEAGWEKGQI